MDKVLGLLERVCRWPLYEMIASVGSEWRFGGIDLRLLGCLFVFPCSLEVRPVAVEEVKGMALSWQTKPPGHPSFRKL